MLIIYSGVYTVTAAFKQEFWGVWPVVPVIPFLPGLWMIVFNVELFCHPSESEIKGTYV